MPKYLLRAIKSVAVYELTGKERVVDADSEQQLGRMVREFMAAEFPGGSPGTWRASGHRGGDQEQGEEVPITEKSVPDEFKPRNVSKFTPGAPF